MQVLGAAALAILYPLENPFYTVGIMIFEFGVLLSALYLLVRRTWIKRIILGTVFSGLALQVAGSFFMPEQYAGSTIVAGIGMVCVGAAVMAGKESRHFGCPEGWLLGAAGFPIMVLGNLIGKTNHLFNAVGFSVLFFLLLSLAGRKLRQRLLPAREAAGNKFPD